jgi:predicted DNA-binding protein
MGFLLTNNIETINILSMKTVSFSLDEETIEGIEALAKKAKLSRSDIVRSMYARMQLEKTFEEMEAQAAPLLKRLGLETEDDVVTYSKSKA